MVKMLLTHSRQGLETATDRFFTPCIESSRDQGQTLSTESAARSTKAFLGTNPARPLPGSKLIMLADLFDCCKLDICWYSRQYRLQLTLNNPDSILFKVFEEVATKNQFFITAIELRVFSEEITREVVEKEADAMAEGGVMMRQLYLTYETQIENHTPNRTYMNQFVNNMIASVLLFPATGGVDAITGIEGMQGVYGNPYQYTHAESGAYTGGVSAFQHIWKNIQVPQTSMMVSSEYAENSDLFLLYRILANCFHDTQLGCALDQGVNQGQGHLLAGPETNNYVMFPAAFNNLTGNLYVDSQMALHRITTSGGAAGATAVIVRIRVNAVEVLANQVVNRMT
jgi:hypothetical protein